MPGPDFLCVGLQKAGTQWLYDQLQNHDDFWMPPYKELHYFDREFPDRKLIASAQKFTDTPERMRQQRARRGDAPLDERAALFYAETLRHAAPPGDLAAYSRFFAMKGDRLSGDITPGYCSLDRVVIAGLAAEFRAMRVCLILRDPVARFWSHWRMYFADIGPFDDASIELETFKRFTRNPKVLARSFPSQIAERWSTAFGERFRFFFLDDVIARPAETRAAILSFVGGDPAKSSNVAADFNRKSRSLAANCTAKMEKMLRSLFEDERKRCARMFGGPAERWPGLPFQPTP